jgi:uncharacterized membrane protein
MSPYWISAVAMLLAQLLAALGVQVDSAAITTTIQTIISIVAA